MSDVSELSAQTQASLSARSEVTAMCDFEITGVLVVGGGNAAHAMAALLPSRGFKTNLMALFADEAAQLLHALDQHGSIKAHFEAHNSPSGIVEGRPIVVSKDAGQAMAGCNVALMPIPTFAYRDSLEALKPHLRPGMAIGVTPGQGGFDWLARDILGTELLAKLVVFALLPMPFNCRITEFGAAVAVQEFKRNFRLAVLPLEAEATALCICEQLFDPIKIEPIGHFLAATLYPLNAVIHPARLWALCHPLGGTQELGSQPLRFECNPLFYESMDEVSARTIQHVDDELQEIAGALRAAGVPIELPRLFDFLARFVYEDESSDDLRAFFTTAHAYKGFHCPFTLSEDGSVWAPDFGNRYFIEDIPFGLVVLKGVAEIVHVASPTIDRILQWAQKGMGKEYVDCHGRLAGKDVEESGSPQRWGISTPEELDLELCELLSARSVLGSDAALEFAFATQVL